MLPPFEKGNVFRVKVTGLLLWSEAEPSRRWEDRELPAKACHHPPPQQDLAKGWKSSSNAPNSLDLEGLLSLAERAEWIHLG